MSIFLGILKGLGLLALFFAGALCSWMKHKRNQKREFKDYINSHQEELKKQTSKELEKLNKAKNDVLVEETRLEEKRKLTEQLLKELDERRQSEIQHKEEIIEETIKGYFSREVDSYKKDIEIDLDYLRQEAVKDWESQMAELNARAEAARASLQETLDDLADWQKRRDAINADIQRAKLLEQQTDYYRICLSKSAKEDIAYLLSIVEKFNNKETIYKLIWSEYIQQPFKTMLNHVLGNTEPRNVIYMIENITTKEIYIGKTKAEVSKRWTEHIKTSLNIGSISRTNIHKALFNNWDNFTFSIIEQVDNDTNLSDREKFYIEFYQSNVYGYNIKSGG